MKPLHLLFSVYIITVTSLDTNSVSYQGVPQHAVIWKGWGCSLAWWGNLFGDDPTVADLMFSLKTGITVSTEKQELSNLPGLGFNIARYNVGGSCGGQKDNQDTFQGVTTELCEYSGDTMNVGGMTDWKRIQGFWMNWASRDVADEKSWRWNVDLNQREMLRLALERDENMVFELFSNSPMWWMLHNKNPSGADLPNQHPTPEQIENLQSWNEQDFAYYLAQVAKYYLENFGIKFETVAPFNEPRGGGDLDPNNPGGCWWWSDRSSQEGCCADQAQQERVYLYLREELENAGLGFMKISSSDESLFSVAATTWRGFNSTVKSVVDQINVHGYEGLYRVVFKKPSFTKAKMG